MLHKGLERFVHLGVDQVVNKETLWGEDCPAGGIKDAPALGARFGRSEVGLIVKFVVLAQTVQVLAMLAAQFVVTKKLIC